ncbi:MAG: glutamyl-tRNA reductase [Candidatus Methanoliparum thermophilum]|uniref:Glutamyl-tRNA reductase n=1 Tax=Methanoliparum thermophilum TaxID=2491083 RepID=A0A520KS97_METT2|nr:glutamyl-tRNA reductase [Candidatus Methanoliparum sp. LAM-1]RZN64627.1 MAG: glutamyl-tRNA reductase [Candidatus Methanoliparum thermophilum]BDC35748.1 glutamyl-tRNA reductase [Candidatus Methanoliparum sp. LAM-1]
MIALLSVSHKIAEIKDIEPLLYKEIDKAFDDFANADGFIILQTCHRFEIYLDHDDPSSILKDYADFRDIDKYELMEGNDVIEHLMRLTCGLDSIVLGENQILGQVKNAYLLSMAKNHLTERLKLIFERAIKAGKRARTESKINKGSVSIGSVAVKLAENILGDLDNKKMLVIGAGETATSVAKSLIGSRSNIIFIANRTFKHAQLLAEEVKGIAVKFEKKEKYIIDSDLVITATSAPHIILDYDTIASIINKRKKPLLLIDISNPRNVDERIASLPNVRLYNIDSLRNVCKTNLKKREEEIKKVETIIEEEIDRLYEEFKEREINDIIEKIYIDAEKIRIKEMNTALKMINSNGDIEKILNDMTRAIKNKILAKFTEKMRQISKDGDIDLIKVFAEV